MKKRKKKRVIEAKFTFDQSAQYHEKDFGRVIRNLQAAGYDVRITKAGTYIFEKFAAEK